MRELMRTLVTAVILVAVATTSVFGDVVAKQGPPDDGVTIFRSPTILEIPLPIANPSTWNEQFDPSTEDLSKYECDGITITSLALKAQKPAKGTIRVSVVVSFRNKPGHDKMVRAIMEVFDGEISIGERGGILNLPVNEGKTAQREGYLFLPEGLLREHPNARLRITVHAKDY
jgi:hypothetical protein